MIRAIFYIPAFILSLIFGMITVDSAFFQNSDSRIKSIENTIEKSRNIEKTILHVAGVIDDFFDKSKRLPTQEEYIKLVNDLPHMYYEPKKSIRYYTSNFPESVTDRFGAPVSNSYVLDLWRGDWSEYYVSWTRSTTLVFEVDAYLTPGYGISIQAAVSIALFIFGVVILRFRLTKPSTGLKP